MPGNWASRRNRSMGLRRRNHWSIQPVVRPELIHGDFTAAHSIFANPTISGDWGMIRHGIGAPFSSQRTGGRPGPRRRRAAERGDSAMARTLRVRGFRHFMKEPAPEQRFRTSTAPFRTRAHEPPQAAPADGPSRQSHAREFKWPAHRRRGIASRGRIPHIPSGYTYLLQLVAHDLVHSSVPISFIEDTDDRRVEHAPFPAAARLDLWRRAAGLSARL